MLNVEQLTHYAAGFIGYGKWSAPVWFIGIEEAGGWTEPEISERLQVWDQRGRLELEDIREFCNALGIQTWHGPNAKLQPTWSGLIRLLLLARGENDFDHNVMQYQRERMAEICLAELSPIPSPNTRTWNYTNWTDVDWLQSRVKCLDEMSPGRILTFRHRIQINKPNVVIFYGTMIPGRSLLPSWSNIADGRFNQGFEDDKILLWRQTGDTVFFVVHHPTRETIPNLRRIGQYFREHHAERFRRL